jgi:hypothetical protein
MNAANSFFDRCLSAEQRVGVNMGYQYCKIRYFSFLDCKVLEETFGFAWPCGESSSS